MGPLISETTVFEWIGFEVKKEVSSLYKFDSYFCSFAEKHCFKNTCVCGVSSLAYVVSDLSPDINILTDTEPELQLCEAFTALLLCPGFLKNLSSL